MTEQQALGNVILKKKNTNHFEYKEACSWRSREIPIVKHNKVMRPHQSTPAEFESGMSCTKISSLILSACLVITGLLSICLSVIVPQLCFFKHEQQTRGTTKEM